MNIMPIFAVDNASRQRQAFFHEIVQHPLTPGSPLMSDRVRILVVDDEETLCEALRFNLEEEGYDVDVAYSAEEALSLDLPSYSLILLDIMMGEISGDAFARILRKRDDTADIPIIFCTAKDSEDEMIAGLELGADDYITKPYSIRNVLARVKSVLRRSGRQNRAENERLDYKGLVVYPDRKVCLIDDSEIRMPRKEFEILSLLLANKGRIFSREELLGRIWPEEVVVLDRVVDVNITRLRAKLGEYGKLIVTRPGYGYGFVGE